MMLGGARTRGRAGGGGEGKRLSSLDKREALPLFDHVFHFALLLGNTTNPEYVELGG